MPLHNIYLFFHRTFRGCDALERWYLTCVCEFTEVGGTLKRPHGRDGESVGPILRAGANCIESGLGVFMLSGLYWPKLRWLLIAMFRRRRIFISLALSGGASCGCFDTRRVHLSWTLFFDMAVVVGRLLAPMREEKGTRRHQRGQQHGGKSLPCQPTV